MTTRGNAPRASTARRSACLSLTIALAAIGSSLSTAALADDAAVGSGTARFRFADRTTADASDSGQPVDPGHPVGPAGRGYSADAANPTNPTGPINRVAQATIPDAVRRNSATPGSATPGSASLGSATLGSATLGAAAPGAAMPGAAAAVEPTPEQNRRDWDAEMATRKSYLIPPLEIVGFDTLLNRIDRWHYGPNAEYSVTARSIRDNLHHSWVIDDDPFSVNQFAHPYQGSMYYGFARSAGLDYWESLGYTFAGSAFWEIAGETTPPSRNDQVASGIGGSFFGEALFRMASLVLERDTGPRWLTELTATAISPATGFNRWAFGDRFTPIFPSHDADYYSRLAIGVTGTTQNDPGLSQRVRRNEGVVDFAMDYGLPGKNGYAYHRPFDYFTFQMTGASGNGVENIMTKGMLVGRDYAIGDGYRGIWGLYGSYDYFAPQVFRLSSTALSLGTTGQAWLTDTIALQGTGMVGAGYAAVGTLHGTDDRDYHYGIAPQALVALRLIFGQQASLDFTGREYFVSKVASNDANNHDNIVRFDTALTWRIRGPHAISLRYVYTRRDSSYGFATDTQTRGTIGLFYTLLGSDRFGASEWRK